MSRSRCCQGVRWPYSGFETLAIPFRCHSLLVSYEQKVRAAVLIVCVK